MSGRGVNDRGGVIEGGDKGIFIMAREGEVKVCIRDRVFSLRIQEAVIS